MTLLNRVNYWYKDKNYPTHDGIDFNCVYEPLPPLITGKIAQEGQIKFQRDGKWWSEILAVIQAEEKYQGKDFFMSLDHLSATYIDKGNRVVRGQGIMAKTGNTGYSTGAHLHVGCYWGVKDPGKPFSSYTAFDPYNIIKAFDENRSYNQPAGGVDPMADKSQILSNIFIANFDRWPDKAWLDAGIASPLEPYTYFQQTVRALYDKIVRERVDTDWIQSLHEVAEDGKKGEYNPEALAHQLDYVANTQNPRPQILRGFFQGGGVWVRKNEIATPVPVDPASEADKAQAAKWRSMVELINKGYDLLKGNTPS